MPNKPKVSVEEIVLADGRYALAAYGFLQDGLDRAASRAGDEEANRARHVTGQQFCHALRELAQQRWGMLARAVLGKWNIHTTIDFGNMVYLLIENNIMSKTAEDSIEDFRDVYNFREAFGGGEDFRIAE